MRGLALVALRPDDSPPTHHVQNHAACISKGERTPRLGEWFIAGGATVLTRTFKALIVVILRFNLDDRFYDENFIAERSLHDDMLSNPKVKSITVHIALLIYVLLRVQCVRVRLRECELVIKCRVRVRV